MAATFAPTTEQQDALAKFATGKSLAIEAGAGAGKTSTLRLLAESTTRRGQYIAFNKAIVEEAKLKMPRTVNAATAHALAYRAVVPGTRYAERLRNSARMKSTEIATRLKVDAIRVTLQDGTSKNLSKSYLAGVVMRGVIRFCQSADLQPEAKHVPYIDGIDLPPGAKANNQTLARALVAPMRKAWADIIDEQGTLPFKHDHYLKMWQLSGPKINAEYILFDEAQDANPVLVDIVKQQQGAQLVWVGDSQQQIYTFTGAINALQQVGAEQDAHLTQSFRFGPAIADVANTILRQLKAPFDLTGTDSIPSTVGPIDTQDCVVLSRTNASAVAALLRAITEGRKAHLVGGGRDVVDFAKAARDLKDKGWTSHPELACFASWGEVQTYVEMDEQGGDLRLLVGLIDEFGVERIISALERMPREEDADLILSTAHKAKGREWDHVQLADDFPADPSGEELRLLYVAVTRAKLRLDVTAIKFLNGGFTPDEIQSINDAVTTTAAEAAAPCEECGATADEDCPRPVGLHCARDARTMGILEKAGVKLFAGGEVHEENLQPLPAAAHAGLHRSAQRTVAEHLAGTQGEYRIMGWGERGAQTLGTYTDSRKAIETASALWGGGSFSRVSVVDQGNGELVVEYDA